MNEIIFNEWKRKLLATGWAEDAKGNLTKRNPLGTVDRVEPKPDTGIALVQDPPQRKSRTRKLVVVVTFIAMRSRLLDSDNFQSSCKPLRDAVAKSLGLDDGSRRYRWEYEQVKTTGEQGTLVRICLK